MTNEFLSEKKPPLGTGARFDALVKQLKARKDKSGKSIVRTPEKLAAWIGRKKFGKKKMTQLSVKGRKMASESIDEQVLTLVDEIESMKMYDSPFSSVREQRIDEAEKQLDRLLEKGTSTSGAEKLYKELRAAHKKGKLGSGERFKSLVKQLKARKGKSKPRDPEAVAAWIGRKKYGKAKMAKMAAAGRKK